MTVFENLISLKSLLDHEDKWNKGTFATDIDGDPVPPKSSKAVCWCLVGGLSKVNSEEDHEKCYNFMIEVLSYDSLVHFNDKEETKYQDIVSFIDKAINVAQVKGV